MGSLYDRVAGLTNELERVTEDAQAAFGSLSHDQLNWKPTSGGWSTAQCLDHLITINSLYFPVLASMRAGQAKRTLWERYSPFSGLLGRLLIKMLSPEYRRKVKTSPNAEPSTGDIAGILDRFAHNQAELIEHVRMIPPGLDLRRTIVTSPLLAWITYGLDDCLTILLVHEKRHLLQAKRVMEAEGFPKSVWTWRQ